jgi:hypothetical protein
MGYSKQKKLDALLPYERLLALGAFNKKKARADAPRAGHRLLPSSNDQQTCTDFSEEAIPERDPAYQVSDGTLHETQTVEYTPASERLALAGCLEQLGMCRSRATVVASL